ncbi:hypothetical protein TruAng_003033 [Truncatella angustata]|nr:hypothetical protein TruAng_003033 [Truncatella angustata]
MPESEDEYETSSSFGSENDRPNRWDGPSSTWREMNQQEINILTTLNEIKNQDLSVHLYNAYALKRRHPNPGNNDRPVPKKDINAVTSQTVQQDEWLPQGSWTAWPMSGDEVPPDEFMRHDQNNGDDQDTIRSAAPKFPSAALEEALGAAVLQSAKEKFESRSWEDALADPQDLGDGSEDDDEELSEPASSSDTEGIIARSSHPRSRSRAKSTSRKKQVLHEGKKHRNRHSDNDGPGAEQDDMMPSHERLLQPTVSTDDQLSYDLMRPTVRDILAKLDATLMVLHRSRDVVVNYLSDSSSSSEPEATNHVRRSRSRGSGPPAKRGRGRPKSGLALRLRTPPPPSSEHDESTSRGPTREGSEADTEGAPLNKKNGRPRKLYPRLQGETDRDWAVRVARLRKEPVPVFKEDVEPERSNSDVSEDEPSETRPTKRKPDTVGLGERPARKRRNAARLMPRDWKDVLGAAALAGFPQDALNRAAKRCAELFGENIELHTMSEGAFSQNDQTLRVQYHPGMLTDLDTEAADEDYYSEDETQSQAARHIRASSVISASSDPRGRSRSRSRSVSRATTRSRSRSISVANSHFCGVRGCERSAEGFSRRSNLVRHMKLVHHMEENGVPTDVNSEDERFGAVHVDGFLKPVKTRKGWRGDDVRRSENGSTKRKYRGRYSKRKGAYGSVTDTGGEDEDIVMGED